MNGMGNSLGSHIFNWAAELDSSPKSGSMPMQHTASAVAVALLLLINGLLVNNCFTSIMHISRSIFFSSFYCPVQSMSVLPQSYNKTQLISLYIVFFRLVMFSRACNRMGPPLVNMPSSMYDTLPLDFTRFVILLLPISCGQE